MRKKLGRSTNLVRAGDPPLPEGELIFEHSFAADTELKNESLNLLLAVLRRQGALKSDSAEARYRLCLDEALVNAVMHGSKYDHTKNVHVRAWLSSTTWTVIVSDEGSGFREEDLPDPDAAENLLEESGRGVHLIRSIMNTVSYWRGGRTLLIAATVEAAPPAS
ncbi:MAG TPA: ATP-binding protein [Planctomycetota bacterium]|nr:ATP-binding protein [Planctomycetota bacterium]